MIMYAVFKEGWYRHECGGIFSNLLKAEDALRKLMDGELDNYHDYVVIPFEIDVVVEQLGGELDEPDELSTTVGIKREEGGLSKLSRNEFLRSGYKQ